MDLINDEGDRSTTSYARYLVSVSIGQILDSRYEVDHIDSDKTNDDLKNLQILTVEDHRLKTRQERSGRTYVELLCPQCGISFQKELRFMNKNSTNHYCGRKCNGLASKFICDNTLADGTIAQIKEMVKLGHSGYKIGKELGISANTARKYMADT